VKPDYVNLDGGAVPLAGGQSLPRNSVNPSRTPFPYLELLSTSLILHDRRDSTLHLLDLISQTLKDPTQIASSRPSQCQESSILRNSHRRCVHPRHLEAHALHSQLQLIRLTSFSKLGN